MNLPHKIATLLYCFNAQDEVLLMERAREPNLGLWSPPGGKLVSEFGESPYECACREAAEELALNITPGDLHLLGIISEKGDEGQAHWLMFLFEVRKRVLHVPTRHREGHFAFFNRDAIDQLKIPRTDREYIWPLVWKYRGGYFAAHCRSGLHGQDQWLIEESRLPGD